MLIGGFFFWMIEKSSSSPLITEATAAGRITSDTGILLYPETSQCIY
jgi:hypothetical protein